MELDGLALGMVSLSRTVNIEFARGLHHYSVVRRRGAEPALGRNSSIRFTRTRKVHVS